VKDLKSTTIDSKLITIKFKHFYLFFIFFLFYSCSPTRILVKQNILSSFYFENKISKYEKKADESEISKKKLLRLYVEYGFGILMEKSDRVILINYDEGIETSKKARQYFKSARFIGSEILSSKYDYFNEWIMNKAEIEFKEEDIETLYWLMAAYSGSISSSRGDPYELINLPIVEKLLSACLKLNSDWNDGALYGALMSFTSIRSDLNDKSKIDTITFYFDKALALSDSLDASLYVTYSELIHKPNLQKELFLKKLKLASSIKVSRKNKYYLSNLIAQNRAQWLISNIDNYFLD